MSNSQARKEAQKRVNNIMSDIEKDMIKPMSYSERQRAKAEIEKVNAKINRKKNKVFEKEMRRNDKPAFLVSISGIFAKVFHIIVTLYTMAIVVNIFFIWNIYKTCATSGFHGLIETLNPVYIAGYFVGLFVLNKIYFLLYKYAND